MTIYRDIVSLIISNDVMHGQHSALFFSDVLSFTYFSLPLSTIYIWDPACA